MLYLVIKTLHYPDLHENLERFFCSWNTEYSSEQEFKDGSVFLYQDSFNQPGLSWYHCPIPAFVRRGRDLLQQLEKSWAHQRWTIYMFISQKLGRLWPCNSSTWKMSLKPSKKRDWTRWGVSMAWHPESMCPQIHISGILRGQGCCWPVISLGKAGLPRITLTSPETSLSDVFMTQEHLREGKGRLLRVISGQIFFFLREV